MLLVSVSGGGPKWHHLGGLLGSEPGNVGPAQKPLTPISPNLYGIFAIFINMKTKINYVFMMIPSIIKTRFEHIFDPPCKLGEFFSQQP